MAKTATLSAKSANAAKSAPETNEESAKSETANAAAAIASVVSESPVPAPENEPKSEGSENEPKSEGSENEPKSEGSENEPKSAPEPVRIEVPENVLTGLRAAAGDNESLFESLRDSYVRSNAAAFVSGAKSEAESAIEAARAVFEAARSAAIESFLANAAGYLPYLDSETRRAAESFAGIEPAKSEAAPASGSASGSATKGRDTTVPNAAGFKPAKRGSAAYAAIREFFPDGSEGETGTRSREVPKSRIGEVISAAGSDRGSNPKDTKGFLIGELRNYRGYGVGETETGFFVVSPAPVRTLFKN